MSFLPNSLISPLFPSIPPSYYCPTFPGSFPPSFAYAPESNPCTCLLLPSNASTFVPPPSLHIPNFLSITPSALCSIPLSLSCLPYRPSLPPSVPHSCSLRPSYRFEFLPNYSSSFSLLLEVCPFINLSTKFLSFFHSLYTFNPRASSSLQPERKSRNCILICFLDFI